MLEGLIRTVLGDDALGRALRQQYVFKIVPMHNVDGIILGNYRTNAGSIDLENQWLNTRGGAFLDDAAPLENLLINRGGMAPSLLDEAAPVVLALNLHSSNAEPDTAAFFFPILAVTPRNTPPRSRVCGVRRMLSSRAWPCSSMDASSSPAEGGAGFLNAWFPETWWSVNRQEAVNAITLETAYGRAGFDHWINQEVCRNLGAAVARAINAMSLQASGISRAPVAEDLSMFRLPFKPEIYWQRE